MTAVGFILVTVGWVIRVVSDDSVEVRGPTAMLIFAGGVFVATGIAVKLWGVMP